MGGTKISGSTRVVGDAELPLGSEDQDQDVEDLVADEIDQQQVAQRLFGGTLLGVGRDLGNVWLGVIAPRALVIDGEVQARPACTLSLTFDHRVLDGANAGRALTDLVDLLQDGRRLRDLAR